MSHGGHRGASLAIDGGPPVRAADRPWPTWPRYTEAARAEVNAALRSGRWTISGAWLGEPTRERRFAQRFAAFHGVDYCTPTSNGSSGLVIALEALDVGAGDEVIVPGLTWVANASAVVRVNAVPILVDVDPETLCLSSDAVRRALSPRTRAICAVHLYSSMADMDALTDLARETGVALIEDCSHSHGAAWRNAAAGTLGDVGVFSMQQTKLLTAGEGGAVITRRPEVARRLEQLRSDGRVFSATPPVPGMIELDEVGDVQGANFCLSEVQAALLLDMEAVTNFYKDTNWAQYATAYDGGATGQTGFYNVMLNDNDPLAALTWWDATCAFRDAMRQQALDTVAAAVEGNYRYYIGSGSRHGMWDNDKVYSDTSGNVPLIVDWVNGMLASAPGAPDAAWTNVEADPQNVVLPGDPVPPVIPTPPFEMSGPDVVINCSPSGAFFDIGSGVLD